MTNSMTGSQFVAASAVLAAKRSPSCQCSLFPTAITAKLSCDRICRVHDCETGEPVQEAGPGSGGSGHQGMPFLCERYSGKGGAVPPLHI
jgi:hypothetical protein